MGAASIPKSTGSHRVNVQDGTNALSSTPAPHTHGSKSYQGQKSRTFTLHLGDIKNRHSAAKTKSSDSDGFVWQWSRDPFMGLLYGFDIGKSDLKEEHKQYLSRMAFEISQHPSKTWKVCLEGRASRTGDAGKNLMLSRDRAIMVHAFLADTVSGVTVQKDWVGEEAAKDAGDPDRKENLFFRSVLLRLWSEDKPKPVPPDLTKLPPALPNPRMTRTFKIRLVSGHSGSVSTPFLKTGSLGIDSATFRIWDVQKKMAADYRYSAFTGGLGVGLDLEGFSGGIYGGGGWATFETPREWTLEGFAGSASLDTVGIDFGFGGPSKGYASFTFHQIQGSRWWPKVSKQTIPDIDTGESFALPSVGGNTAIQGSFIMIGKPFSYAEQH